MSFTNGRSHSFGGEHLELVPHKGIRYTDRLDDPDLPGLIDVAVTLREVSVGTEINVVRRRACRWSSRWRPAISAGGNR